MSSPSWHIESQDFYNLSDAELQEHFALAHTLHQERLPDDPPLQLDDVAKRMRNVPRMLDMQSHVARSGDGAVVGSLNCYTMPGESNPHVLNMTMSVAAAWREQGIGRAFLNETVTIADQRDRSLIISDTQSKVPAGDAFAQRVGARPGVDSYMSQLALAEVDPQMIAAWIADAAQERYALSFVEGPYDDDLLAQIAKLLEVVVNDQPRGDLAINDEEITPEVLQQIEQMHFGAGGKRWTAIVRERASGDFAGYSEIRWRPSRPSILHQEGTGVFAAHRGQGLGRWMKAAMLQRVLAELPDARFVRTDNAQGNAPMLRINEQLGFQVYYRTRLWQLNVDDAKAYLAG